MPMNPANYHPDWDWMSRQIRDQADNRCEWCGVPNGEAGARDAEGTWWSCVRVAEMSDAEAFRRWPDHGFPGAYVRIVLTVHHQCDCDKRTCWDPTHLVALCQKCHLNADRPHHLAVQRANRIKRRGQVEMALPGANA